MQNTIQHFLKKGKGKEKEFARDYTRSLTQKYKSILELFTINLAETFYLGEPDDIKAIINTFLEDTIFSDEKTDMLEHWDLQTLNEKIDVKSIKKVRRNDDTPNDNIHWVELKNVNGNLGWLYGEADSFAFETNNSWVLVDKIKLQTLVAHKCKDKIFCSKPQLYKLYQRKGRQDVITMVETSELYKIAKEIIPKKPI
jgi:hypothetical protein